MKAHGLVLMLALVAAGQPARAALEDEGGRARVRFVDGSVALQAPDDAGSVEARGNLPFLPGDRLWSDDTGRVEVQFGDGAVLRLDRRAKLDYAEHEGRRQPAVETLSLWSGSLYLHVPDQRRRSDYLIETPDGRVDVSDGGRYRIDVDDSETRLLVFEGLARLEGDRGVRVEAGESASLRRDEAPSRPRPFDEWDVNDDFARWDADLGDPLTWRADSQRYLPDELAVYGDDLDRNGTWYYEAEVGYVWRPRVVVGWSPYVNGAWTWTAYGWTWVPYEPWGWAPSHYGRWGHSSAHGWYWIPGRRWGPAWVSWRVTRSHVGWCALGHHDRPVTFHHDGPDRAVPRGQAPRPGGAWTFVSRGDLQARDLARRRVALSGAEAGAATPLEPSRQRLGRDLRVLEGPLAPRVGRARPTPGDYVPELRNDQLTTIPVPGARRRPADEPRFSNDDRGAARSRAERPAADPDGANTRQPQVGSERRSLPDRRDEASGRESHAEGRRSPSVERERARQPLGGGERREPEARPRQDTSRRTPPAERDVLRRFFGAFGGSRDQDREARPRERERDREGDRRSGSSGGSSWRHPERGARQEAPRSQPQPRSERSRDKGSRHEAPRSEDKARPRPPRER